MLAGSNRPTDSWKGRPAAVRVRHLRLELRIDVAEADAAERRAAGDLATGGADAEQRLVGQDVLAAEQSELAAGQDLAPGSADRQVHLTHVDLGAEAVMRHDRRTLFHRVATALNLGGEPEVHAEVGVALFALGVEHREGREQAGANTGCTSPPAADDSARCCEQ